MSNPPTPSFPMENKKEIEEVSSKSDDFIVENYIKNIVEPIFKDEFAKETLSNHILVGGAGSKKDFSYSFYNPHNARYYFVFNKWNFKPSNPSTPSCPYFEVVNSKEFLLKDFEGFRILVKKNLIEITNKLNSERVFRIEGSQRNRRLQVVEAVTTLEKECINILRRVVSIYGGATDFKCVKVVIPDNKIYHDKVIDGLPEKLTFRDEVVKKVYLESPNNVEFSDPVYASNYFQNMGLKEYAPEIVDEINKLNVKVNSFDDDLNKLREVTLLEIENKKLHMEVLNEMKVSLKAIQENLSNNKSERVRKIKEDYGW